MRRRFCWCPNSVPASTCPRPRPTRSSTSPNLTALRRCSRRSGSREHSGWTRLHHTGRCRIPPRRRKRRAVQVGLAPSRERPTRSNSGVLAVRGCNLLQIRQQRVQGGEPRLAVAGLERLRRFPPGALRRRHRCVPMLCQAQPTLPTVVTRAGLNEGGRPHPLHGARQRRPVRADPVGQRGERHRRLALQRRKHGISDDRHAVLCERGVVHGGDLPGDATQPQAGARQRSRFVGAHRLCSQVHRLLVHGPNIGWPKPVRTGAAPGDAR